MKKVEYLIEKFDAIAEKLGKQNVMLITFITVVLIITGLYSTFSLFTSLEGEQIIDGLTTYKFVLDPEMGETSVIIAGNTSKMIDIVVTNDEDTTLKYGIYYNSSDNLNDISLGYVGTSPYKATDNIEAGAFNKVTLKISNNSSSNVTINFGLSYGMPEGGELKLPSGNQWVSTYYMKLSEAEVGSYVAYAGNNGCSGTACEANEFPTACYSTSSQDEFNKKGWRIGYIDDGIAHLISAGATECLTTYTANNYNTILGEIGTVSGTGSSAVVSPKTTINGNFGSYGLDSIWQSYDFSTTAGYYDLQVEVVDDWTSLYNSNRTSGIYLSNQSGEGATNNTSILKLVSYVYNEDTSVLYGNFEELVNFSTNDAVEHLNNLNFNALKYCNKEYAYNGVCDETTAWAMTEDDFILLNNTSTTYNFDYCYKNAVSECGLTNDLIDVGGWYWFTNSIANRRPVDSANTGLYTYKENVFVWNASEDRIRTLPSNYNLGLRPVLKLDSEVLIASGSGVESDPYIIAPDITFDTYNPVSNAPNLDNGNLIPVYYDESAEVWKKADSTNSNNSWYDYDNKKWANAIMVKDNTKRSTYQSATVGTPITESDISGFLVWIPRYKYRVWNITRQGGPENTYAYPAYTKGIDIMWEEGITSTGNVSCTYNVANSTPATTLSDQCTVDGTAITPESSNTNFTDAWYTHPAFTFNGKEKSGFWIGKFETTGTAEAPTVLPDAVSLREQTVSAQFTSAKVFQNYGLSSSVDAHMLTNLEWGAVAYLTHSIYGLCEVGGCRDIYINNSSGYYTGRSAGVLSPNSIVSTYGTYDYKGYSLDSNTGVLTETKDISKISSTTGNVTGIYDMSGGSYDRVMGNMVDENNAFYPSESETNWNGSTTLEQKYYNAYSYGITQNDQLAFNRARLGDGTAEVTGTTGSYYSTWLSGSGVTGANSNFPSSDHSWFDRGAAYSSIDAGSFAFHRKTGGGIAYTFRSSIS